MEPEVSKSRGDREIMAAPASETKRRKTDHTPSRRTLSSAAVERERVSASMNGSTLPVSSGSEFRIQQAKNFAVAQAQQDGCTGNDKHLMDELRGKVPLPLNGPEEFAPKNLRKHFLNY